MLFHVFSNVLWLQRSMRRFAKAAGAEAAGPSGHTWIFIGHKFLSRADFGLFSVHVLKDVSISK